MKKVELHLHLDGSLSVKSVHELLKINNMEDMSDAEIVKQISVSEDCHNLIEYLEKFALPVSLLQTKEALSLAMYNLCEELKAMDYIYAEIRFAPQFHRQKGLSLDEVVEAVIDGANKSSFKSGILLCLVRGHDVKTNMEVVELTHKYLGKNVVGLDIACDESLYSYEEYKELFGKADSYNIPYTIHCGEACGEDSMKAALTVNPKRIGHGVRCLESKEVVDELLKRDLLLELCPTSNLQTCIYEKIEEYPIRKLMDLGIKVCINNDNMMVSNTNLDHEINILKNAFNLTEEEIKGFMINAINYAFCDKMLKLELLKELK